MQSRHGVTTGIALAISVQLAGSQKADIIFYRRDKMKGMNGCFLVLSFPIRARNTSEKAIFILRVVFWACVFGFRNHNMKEQSDQVDEKSGYNDHHKNTK